LKSPARIALKIRCTYTNNSGTNVTCLRFRIINITSFPSPSSATGVQPTGNFRFVVNIEALP
jgi:hypothetical protein